MSFWQYIKFLIPYYGDDYWWKVFFRCNKVFRKQKEGFYSSQIDFERDYLRAQGLNEETIAKVEENLRRNARWNYLDVGMMI